MWSVESAVAFALLAQALLPGVVFGQEAEGSTLFSADSALSLRYCGDDDAIDPPDTEDPAEVPDLKDQADSGWRFELTPYLHLPNVEGNATVFATAPIDLGFSDIFDNLNGAISGRFVASKGKWGFIVDVMAVGVSAKNKLLAFNLDVDVAQVNVDIGVSRQFGPVSLRKVRSDSTDDSFPRISITPMAGGRYGWLKQDITLGLFPTLGGSRDWVEPWVGGKVTLELTERVMLGLRGDVGGFGIGTATNLTWNLWAGGGYRFSDRVYARLGWRWYDIDYERGSGLDRFGVDVQFSGPFLGITFVF